MILSISTLITILFILIIGSAILAIIDVVLLSEEVKLIELHNSILECCDLEIDKLKRDLFIEKGGKLEWWYLNWDW